EFSAAQSLQRDRTRAGGDIPGDSQITLRGNKDRPAIGGEAGEPIYEADGQRRAIDKTKALSGSGYRGSQSTDMVIPAEIHGVARDDFEVGYLKAAAGFRNTASGLQIQGCDMGRI